MSRARLAEATLMAGFKVSDYDVRCNAATTLILSILNLLKMLTAASVGCSMRIILLCSKNRTTSGSTFIVPPAPVPITRALGLKSIASFRSCKEQLWPSFRHHEELILCGKMIRSEVYEWPFIRMFPKEYLSITFNIIGLAVGGGFYGLWRSFILLALEYLNPDPSQSLLLQGLRRPLWRPGLSCRNRNIGQWSRENGATPA